MALDRDLVAAALPAYEVGKEIGRGGWGVVFHGHHIALGRDVAIKQLPRAFAADANALERFKDEARIIGQLDHPHIVQVHDFVEHDGMWLIIMEFLGGGTLWDRFTSEGMKADTACAIALTVCSGLEAAHGLGVLHRDIKPENVLFASDGTSKLGDFGIARNLNSSADRRTQVGEVVGTPTYMSPEQALGDELDAGSDIYSLGIVLYELLAGRLPFDEARSPTQQLIQHVSDEPLPIDETAPEVPSAVGDAVMTALEKRPANRFSSAQAFGVALARAASESFGPRWLSGSGIELLGGGKIHSAALRGPTMGAPVRAPTFARPALRADHFRLDEPASTGEVAGFDAPAEAAPPRQATTAPRGVAAPVPQPGTTTPEPQAEPREPSSTSTEASSSEQELAPPPPEQAPPAFPPPAEPGGLPSPGAGGGDNKIRTLIVAGVVAAIVAVGLIGYLVFGGDGSDGTDLATGAESATTAPQTTATAPVDTTAAETTAPTTTAPTTTTTTTTTTTLPIRECDDGARCAFIDSVTVDGDSLVIEWTAEGFDPVIAEDQFHVHFFWDIYSPDQAGTNASVFGVSTGAWELTDQQPFVSADEMRPSQRPPAANQICVTPANAAHAIVDPLQFDCVPIPDEI